MSERRKFKVGDVVYVRGGDFDKTLSGPFTIEKQHKGNGNLYVNGQQYGEGGWSRGGTGCIHSSLILSGTPECDEAIRLARWKRVRGWIVELAREWRKEAPDEAGLEAAEAAIVALRNVVKPKVQA